MSKTLTMTQYLDFLKRDCLSKISGRVDDSAYQRGKDEAYAQVISSISVFTREYCQQKDLTKQAEQSWLNAIESDVRRDFDDPFDLIEHIYKIASNPPYFDSGKVPLAAINGFCGDFIRRHRSDIQKELLQSAPF